MLASWTKFVTDSLVDEVVGYSIVIIHSKYDVVFSSDGSKVESASDDKTVKVSGRKVSGRE